MTLAVAWFQSLLYGLGWAMALLYRYIPNYGVAVIVLTLLIRVVLLPLGLKQIRSMQAMQAIQPKVKALQQKYKGNRQKLNEETMALYKEHGVNPFSGCLPLLLQFPVLIALYAVLRVPGGLVHIPESSQLKADIAAHHVLPASNYPANNRLAVDIVTQAAGVRFLGANMLCSAGQAGSTVKITYPKDTAPYHKIESPLDCGKGVPVRIPYYIFAAAMIATTFYQQRQMQRASPPGASQQQQMLTKVMPILFGVWGFLFPSGLVVYWTTTNIVQIGQQHFMLPKKGEGPPEPKAIGDGGRRGAGGPRGQSRRPTGGRPGGQSQRRDGQGGQRKPGTGRQSGGSSGRLGSGGASGSGRRPDPPGRSGSTGGASGGTSGGTSSGRPGETGREGQPGRPRPRGTGSSPGGGSGRSPGTGGTGGMGSAGGGDAGDRKKRRKR